MGANLTKSQTVPLRRYARGPDAEAFAAIVRLYEGMVYSTGLRITGDAHYAADVTQETFFHLLQNAGRITGSLGGWLHQVATRRAIDLVRRDSSRRRREEAYAAESAVQTDSWADISPLVDEALSQLDEASRDLIIRHFLEGKKMVQIAAAEGVSQPTVSRHVEQALQSLRERLRLKGVLVAGGVLGGMLVSSTASAVPAGVMVELGKMSALSAGAAGAAAKTTLSALKMKLAAVALIAATGAGGYVAYRAIDRAAAPAAPVVVPARASPPANGRPRVPMVAATRGPAPAKKGKVFVAGVKTNSSPVSANRPGVKPR